MPSPTIPTRLTDPQKLHAFAVACLHELGVTPDNAAICADGMLLGETRNLTGQGQGFRKLVAYLSRIRKGELDPRAPLTVVSDVGAVTLLDANNGLGVVAGVRAMGRAIARARELGIAIVGVRGSTHFGTAAHHAMLALPHDLIGIAMTNAGAEMAPWGGYRAVIGTNPWSVAIPAGAERPIVLDMANTTAGKGMMDWLRREGRPMPRDWALTPDGRETDDPAEAMDGPLLPAGGPKGYGIAVVVDALAGVLTGAAFASACYADPRKLDVGHQFIALDPACFQPLAEFKARMDALIREIKATPTLPGFAEIMLPGEPEARRAEERLAHGIPLDQEIYTALADVAQQLGVRFTVDR